MADIVTASDRSLLVIFGNTLSLENHTHVMDLWRALDQVPLPGVTSISPAYASVLIRYDPLRVTTHRLESRLRELITVKVDAPARAVVHPRRVEIPVCYEAPYSPDLENVARESGLNEAEVIQRHCGPSYRVYFLGFAPGFAYLGDVDERIAAPRRATPRASVPRGAVGIAGRQTGIYPRRMPGGWRLIGQCPLPMVETTPGGGLVTLLQPGDTVSFVPIPSTRYKALENL